MELAFDFWILRGRIPVPCHDIFALGAFLDDPARIVGRDQIGPALVSTVFAVSVVRDGPPQFETMIISGPFQLFGRRRTWAGAEAMHAEAVAFVRAGLMRADAALAAITER